RPINVEPVDFIYLRDADSDRERAVANHSDQFLTLFCDELLGVVNALDVRLRREDDRGGDHRPRHRADARFVHARDGLDASAPEFPFVAEIGMTGHGVTRASSGAPVALFPRLRWDSLYR